MSGAALVVGIDQYDDTAIRSLSGNVYSAKLAVDWLINNGVPPDRIWLHLSRNANPQDFQACNIKSAQMDPIVSSLVAMSRLRGERLYIFLCGHGLHVPGANGGPIFLGQDYGALPPFTRKNMRLDGLIYWTTRWGFDDQFLFYDACQNPSTSVGQVSLVEAMDPTVLASLPVSPLAGLLACLAASPGQTAWAGTGQGVLVRHVLDAIKSAADPMLPPDAQEQDSILFDWTTGRQSLDLRSLFNNIVAPAIIEEAAQAKSAQNPVCRAEGRATTASVSPILDLPAIACTSFTLQVRPLIAVTAVKRLRLSIQTPTRSLYLPSLGIPVAGTSQWVAPAASEVETTCTVNPGTWSLRAITPSRANLGNPTVITLDFVPPPPGQPAGTGGAPLVAVNAFSVRLHSADGSTAARLSGAYESIADTYGVSMNPPPGVSFWHHEIGPDIGFDPTVEGADRAAADFARQWHVAIQNTVSVDGISVNLFPPGVDPEGKVPNLRLRLPEGGAKTVAGFLTDSNSLSVTEVSTEEPAFRRSLAQIELDPLEWVEPGTYRVTIDLPWGAWSRRIIVSAEDRMNECKLPERIGRPPLRNQWAKVDVAPRETADARDAGVTPLLTEAVPLLMEWDEGEIRIEPYSQIPVPEWDLMFTAGRFDMVPTQRIDDLIETPPAGLTEGERDLLMLGLAYSAYQQGAEKSLTSALQAIAGPLTAVLDISLLQNWLLNQSDPKDGHEAGRAIIEKIESHFLASEIALREGASLLARIYAFNQLQLPEWLPQLLNGSVIASTVAVTIDGQQQTMVSAQKSPYSAE